jgi:enoyl-CoA hydratase/carnithine racemase
MAATLAREGDVHVLDLGDGENRIDRDGLRALHALLDEVEAAHAPRSLVTVASGKFWCNGFDQEWMVAHPEEVDRLLDEFRGLVARLVVLPLPTVAALQGHAFAAGAMFALAHDFRVAREDRGYFCLPEIDLGRALSAASVALVRAKVPGSVLSDLLIRAHRYSGPEAVAAGLAGAVASAETVRSAAIELAASLAGKDPQTLAVLKQRMWGAVVDGMVADASAG